MSRVGKELISLPTSVKIVPSGNSYVVSGPKGDLPGTLPHNFELEVTDNTVKVLPKAGLPKEEKMLKAQWGLYKSLLHNQIIGVSEGFKKELEVVGVGYRVQAQSEDKLQLSLGFSHPMVFTAPEGIKFEVRENVIAVLGIDKSLVGKVAADIRAIRLPEPYKGKGIRYKNEVVRRRAGKSAKA